MPRPKQVVQISEHFIDTEWIDEIDLRSIRLYGWPRTWFINPKLVEIAEAYKAFFCNYFMSRDDSIADVQVIINDRINQGRALRGPNYAGKGAKFSQHKFMNGFDCHFIIVYKDRTRKRERIDQKIIFDIIMDHEQEFLDMGVTTIESVRLAPTWLHTDIRWIKDQTKIFVI